MNLNNQFPERQSLSEVCGGKPQAIERLSRNYPIRANQVVVTAPRQSELPNPAAARTLEQNSKCSNSANAKLGALQL